MNNKSRAFLFSIFARLALVLMWHLAFISYATTRSALAFGFMCGSVTGGLIGTENVEHHLMGLEPIVWSSKSAYIRIAGCLVVYLGMMFVSSMLIRSTELGAQILGYMLECIVYFTLTEAFFSIVRSSEKKDAKK